MKSIHEKTPQIRLVTKITKKIIVGTYTRAHTYGINLFFSDISD
nr:MAG TPA: hypothetical protein [Caudoviricetes sp.]